MRAACRELGGGFEGYDLLFIANRGTTTIDYPDLITGYREALKRLETK